MFYLVDSGSYMMGVYIVLIGAAFFCFYMAIKTGKKQKAMKTAIEKFETMANDKTYDEIVAVMKKPQEEYEKTCPNTGHQIKVAKWKGGFYYWEQCRYDIVVVFDEDGKFNNVKMYE